MVCKQQQLQNGLPLASRCQFCHRRRRRHNRNHSGSRRRNHNRSHSHNCRCSHSRSHSRCRRRSRTQQVCCDCRHMYFTNARPEWILKHLKCQNIVPVVTCISQMRT